MFIAAHPMQTTWEKEEVAPIFPNKYSHILCTSSSCISLHYIKKMKKTQVLALNKPLELLLLAKKRESITTLCNVPEGEWEDHLCTKGKLRMCINISANKGGEMTVSSNHV